MWFDVNMFSPAFRNRTDLRGFPLSPNQITDKVFWSVSNKQTFRKASFLIKSANIPQNCFVTDMVGGCDNTVSMNDTQHAQYSETAQYAH